MSDENPYAQLAQQAQLKTAAETPVADNPYAKLANSSGDGLKRESLTPAPAPGFSPMPGAVQLLKGSVQKYSLDGFKNNVIKEGSELMKVAAVLGSLATLRFNESRVPKMVLQPHLAKEMVDHPSLESISEAFMPKGLIQKDDPQKALEMGKSIVDDYKKFYVDPISQGHPEQILDNAYNTPIRAVTDVLPVAGWAGKVAKPAIKAVSKAPIVAKAGQAIANVAEKTPLIGYIMRTERAIKNIRGINEKFMLRIAPALQELKQLYNKIPANVRDQVIEIGEMRNVGESVKLRQKHPEVVAFLQKANEIDDAISQELIAAKAFTPEQHFLAKYGPYARARGYLQEGMVLEDGTITQEAINALQAAKAELDPLASFGLGLENPNYFGIIRQGEIDATSSLERGIFNGKYVGVDPNDIPTQTWQRTRTGEAGAGNRQHGRISNHAYDVFKTRFLQGRAHLDYGELFAELVQNPDLLKGVGSAPVEIGKALENLAAKSGLSPEAAQQAIKQLGYRVIHMPEEMARLLNEILGVGEKSSFADKWTNLYKQFSLGLNFWWATFQTMQNQMVLPFAMANSLHPRELVRTMMAYAAAFDPRFKALVESMTTDIVSEARFTPYAEHAEREAAKIEKFLLEKGVSKGAEPVAKAIGALTGGVSKYMETVFGVAQMGDNQARLTKFAHGLMTEAEAAPNAVKPALNEMFSMQARLDQMGEAIANPAMRGRAAEDVYRWLGKYDSLTAAQWSGLRKMFPFALWWLHSFSIAWALPTKAPLRTAILERLMQHVPAMFQPDEMPESYKEKGAIAITDKNGNWLKGPDGSRLVIFGAGGNPNMQPLELAQQFAHVLGYSNAEREGLPVMRVDYAFLLAMAGVASSNLQSFNAPNYKGRGGVPMTAEGQQIQMQNIPVSNSVIRNVFGLKFDKNLREWVAYPFVPTDATSVLNNQFQIQPMKKVDRMHPTGYKQFDAPILAAMQILNAEPTRMYLTKGAETVNKNRQRIEGLRLQATQPYVKKAQEERGLKW